METNGEKMEVNHDEWVVYRIESQGRKENKRKAAICIVQLL